MLLRRVAMITLGAVLSPEQPAEYSKTPSFTCFIERRIDLIEEISVRLLAIFQEIES